MTYNELNCLKYNCLIARLAGAVEYSDCTSAEGKSPPTIVLDMTQNYLMVRFQ